MFQMAVGKEARARGRVVGRGAVEPMTRRSEFVALRPKRVIRYHAVAAGKRLAGLEDRQ